MGDAFMVALRAIHVATAVFWAGGTFLLAGFHDFVLNSAGDDGTLARMADYAGVSQYVGVSGIVAVLSGLVLYWRVSGGVDAGWVGSAYGATITVGALAGLAAVVVGVVLVGLTNNRLVSLYEDQEEGDVRPSGEVQTVEALRVRLRRGERLVALLLLVAVLAMATAQYV